MNKISKYFEESDGNKYLTLVPNEETEDTLKKYEGQWSKIRDLIRSTRNNSDNYEEKHMKTKFSSDADLPLKKTKVL